MMGEHPSTYWWSLNGNNKLQPPQPLPQHEASNNFFSSLSPSLSAPPSASNSILNHHPFLFGSSLLANPPNYALALADHHHHQENQDFPAVSWSQLLLSGLAATDQEHNLGGGHVGGEEVVKQNGYLDHNQQQSSRRQFYYNNNNNNKNDDNNINNVEEDVQAACSSSWSCHQLNPVDTSVASSNSTMSLSTTTTTTMFDFSSKIHTRNQHTNQYSSSQYDDTSTSGASKKPRFQSSSTQVHPPPSMCNDTLIISGTSKRARAQHSSTQTPLKVRKEKLGDRISALHQLVSPFGKTDTASVLLEATVQIRFLEGQIQALSSPYMNLGNNNVNSGNTRHQHSSPADAAAAGKAEDLASRGLCLVPVTHLDHIDTTNMTSNGAEFWTPALGGGF